MKLSQHIYTFEHHSAFNDLQTTVIGFPGSFSSLSLSPLPLCDLIRKSTAFFLRWLALSKIPCRKNDACRTTEQGSTHGMSHYKWPLADLTVWLQRVKAAFWCWGIFVSPGVCREGQEDPPCMKAASCRGELERLPASACWRQRPGSQRGTTKAFAALASTWFSKCARMSLRKGAWR